MKATGFIAALVLAVLCVTPSFAAGATLDKAVAMAAQNSGVGLSDICLAAYNAAKETPDKVDVVFSEVISQRTNWTSGEVYAIFRSVLLASPGLEQQSHAYIAAYTGQQGGSEQTESTSENQTAVQKLYAALQSASLSPGVVPAVMNSLASHAAYVGQGAARSNVQTSRETPANGTYVTPVVVPTPGPMSPLF